MNNPIRNILRPSSSIPPSHQRWNQVGLYGYPYAALVHLSFIGLFSLLEVTEMIWFNLVAIALILTLIPLIKKGYDFLTFSVFTGIVVGHAAFAVHFVGWELGFQYFIFVLVGILAMAYDEKVWLKGLIFLFAMISFIVLYYYALERAHEYVSHPTLVKVVNILNLVVMFATLGAFVFYFRKIAERAEAALAKEHARSEALLHNILPVSVAEQLKSGKETLAEGFAEATVLFSDLVGFTPMAKEISPQALVRLLNEIVTQFDHLAEKHGLEKIKTIGDAYMAAAGIPEPRPDHARAMANFALDMLEVIAGYTDHKGDPLMLRIGMNTGEGVAGVIGKKKFIYDLWGDCVNLAARMESHGLPGEIQVSESTYHQLKEDFHLEPRGRIEVKGKGPMNVYLLKGRKPA